jgi:hypothetical protein
MAIEHRVLSTICVFVVDYSRGIQRKGRTKRQVTKERAGSLCLNLVRP